MDANQNHGLLNIRGILCDELLSERWARPTNAARVSRRFVRPMSRDASSHRKKSAVPMSSTAVQESVDYRDIQPESISSILRALEEKEKDLELAAKIGNSLLEQNKELQERNEFLEESLNTSNETIHQLQYQLKQRSSLFHAIADLDDEEDRASGSFTGYLGTIDRTRELESRVKSLESENQRLKGEASRLEDHAVIVEKRERERIKDYLGQLERANLKIGRLQEQITEKNKECAIQAEETERLMKEISQRKNREKTLIDVNDDVTQQLTSAINNHEALKVEISSLQEKYLDVMGMLRETQDELRGYRQQAAIYRTSSADSLYDSLASELEASDSGCYNTPMFTARCESQQSSSHNQQDLGLQLSDLEQTSSREESSEEIEIEGLHNTSPSTSYDVPTRALVNAVRSASARAPATRSMSADLSSENEAGPSASARWPSTFAEVTGDVNTPLAEEIMSFSSISYQSTTSIKTIIPAIRQVGPPKRCDSTGTISLDHEVRLSKEQLASDIDKNDEQVQNGKTYRDTSCSPVSFEPPQTPTCAKPSTQKFVCRPETMKRRQETSISTKHVDPVVPSTSFSSTDDSTLSKSNSSDSLEGYNKPKLGEPGRPGTRDLEFSIRRLDLKKQIEKQYEEFRRQRGLPPSKFYSSAIAQHIDGLKRMHKKEDEQRSFDVDEALFGRPSIFGQSTAFNNPGGCWRRAIGPVHIARPSTLEVSSEGKEGVVLRNADNAVLRIGFPKSGSCSRIDGILHRLSQLPSLSRISPSPSRPEISQCQESSNSSLLMKLNGVNLMRPGNIPSLFLLKHHVPKRLAVSLTNQTIGNQRSGMSVSRGTSPVADFAGTEIVGLNNVSTGLNNKTVGIIQRFGGQNT